MSKEDAALREATDQVMSHHGDINRSMIQDLIKARSLSSVMEALNQRLIDGSAHEKERARIAIHKLGFVPD